jgi:hypothetical protein
MKTAIFAAALALTATTASAEGLGFTIVGNAEYAVEAEAIETNLGAELFVFNAVTISPLVTFAGTTDSFEFTGVELGATYTVTENFDVYGVVEADKDFEYSEAIIGVSFAF